MILKEKLRVLLDILSSEDSYLNIRNIIQKVKFSSTSNISQDEMMYFLVFKEN